MDSPLRIAVGVPLDCGHRHEFWLSLIKTVHCAGHYVGKGGSLQFIWNPGDSLICRARNNIVHDFLMNPQLGQPEYLVFIDSDIGFEPEDLFRILSHRVKGIVCGQYFLKQQKPQLVANCIKGEVADKRGLVKIKDAGTGFMAIHRDVFTEMKDKMPPSHYYRCDANRDMRFSFFNAGPANGRYLSEDYLFCHRAGALGFPVLLDTNVTVRHAGWITYPLAAPEPEPKKKNGLRRSNPKR